MKWSLWIFENNKKCFEIPKACVSGVSLGLKTDDVQQLKFTLNNRNLDIQNYIIKTKNANILLEVEGIRTLFYVAKYEQTGRSGYNLNLVASFFNIRFDTNPLQNQTYTGSLIALISQLAPNWIVNQINNLDAQVSISVGSDDEFATIKKAIEQAGWRWRITGYNSQYQPILELGNPNLLPAKVQLSNYTNVTSFGDKNIIHNLSIQISNEYTSQILATGKYDTGTNPEFNLAGYISPDSAYPVVGAGAVQDQTLATLLTREVVKKYTIPATIPAGDQAKDYLCQTARADLVGLNSALIGYTIEASVSKLLLPMDKVFIHYNKVVNNQSGQSVQRITDTKIVAGIQYDLDTNKVGISLSNSGQYTASSGSRNIFALNKAIKSLTQST